MCQRVNDTSSAMDLLCRLCMKSSPFHVDASDQSFSQILQDLFDFQIEPTDASKIVCNECIDIVTEFHSFYTQVKEVQRKFLSKISEGSSVDAIETYFVDESFNTLKSVENVDIKEEPGEYFTDDDEPTNTKSRDFSDSLKILENAKVDTSPSSKKIKLESDSKSDRNYVNEVPIEYYTNDEKKNIKLSHESNTPKKDNISILDKVSSSIPDLPSELFRNGKLILKGPSLENLIGNFFQLKCDMCTNKLQFVKLFELFKHYETEHQTKGYVTCCNSKLYQRRTICYHMAQHLQPSAFQCSICQKTVSRPNNMSVHMKTHLLETEKPHKCDECDKSYSSARGLVEHKITTHNVTNDTGTYECKICGKIFTLHLLYTRHMANVHGKVKYLCSICGRSFQIKTQLTLHMFTHDPPDKHKIKCPECGVMLKNKMSLHQHMKLHSQNFFKCSLCDFTTPLKKKLKPHMLVKHSDVKPHRCDICGKRFKLKNVLQNHMAQHTSERKYICSFCPKTFASSGNYYTHRKRMHAEECNNEVFLKNIDSDGM